ncbi:MAG: metalloregulator ArsR/SmtB family transcription factor [Actinomycetota bacterium]
MTATSSAAEGTNVRQPADLATVLAGLRAAGEHTRLRILALLDQGELTVSELCRILGQTQPRVSRHLKLLVDAGLLDRHSEGTSAFYAPTRVAPGRAMLDAVLSLVDLQDPTLTADHQRLDAIRAERAEAAGHYFEQIAERWDGVRSLHVADTDVEEALLRAATDHRIDDGPIRSLLDIGTGTGRILELFANRIDRGLGIDLSKAMLNLARTNLTRAGHDHLSVRHGNIYAPEIVPGSYDLAVLHHVLHFLDEPYAAINAAVDGLRPGGLLIIVDFAPHQLESLRTDHAHRRLGFTDQEIAAWCEDAGLNRIEVSHLVPTTAGTTDDLLTVGLWTAIRPLAADGPTPTDGSTIDPEST